MNKKYEILITLLFILVVGGSRLLHLAPMPENVVLATLKAIGQNLFMMMLAFFIYQSAKKPSPYIPINPTFHKVMAVCIVILGFALMVNDSPLLNG